MLSFQIYAISTGRQVNAPKEGCAPAFASGNDKRNPVLGVSAWNSYLCLPWPEWGCKEPWLTGPTEELGFVVARWMDEGQAKKLLSVDRWIDDANWAEALERLVSRPTVNIEGLVGGYTGPGGKTVLPHQAIAKLDLRLVPDMTAQEALASLKQHLAKRGYADVEVRMTGGYDPTRTPSDSGLIKAQTSVLRRHGIEPLLWPRGAGSRPGFVFTDPPLRLPAGHFGLGHGSGAHAPDENYVSESTDPKVEGLDGATLSFVECLYELAAV